MRLASIHTYPVKSCRRIDHDDAPVQVQPWGLTGDRRWVLIDRDNLPVTQRECAAMTRIRPDYAPGRPLRLSTAGLADLTVHEPAHGQVVVTTVWGTPVHARAAGTEADQWLSTALQRDIRLLWLDDPARRPVDPAYAEPDDRVSFADGYPLLLTNLASLAAVNGWLREAGSREGPLPMARFRPNVVLDEASAWAEDNWLGQRLRIGTVTFRVVKPCSRCVVTTTDQETGARGREPLRTLGRHRNVDQRLLFGMNLIPDAPFGEIAAGAPVQVVG